MTDLGIEAKTADTMQGNKLEYTDWSQRERVINVLTSAPYVVVGASMFRSAPSPSRCVLLKAPQQGMNLTAEIFLQPRQACMHVYMRHPEV